MSPEEEERAIRDHWVTEQAISLQVNYGHDFGTARLLAEASWDMMSKPGPLILVTGI